MLMAVLEDVVDPERYGVRCINWVVFHDFSHVPGVLIEGFVAAYFLYGADQSLWRQRFRLDNKTEAPLCSSEAVVMLVSEERNDDNWYPIAVGIVLTVAASMTDEDAGSGMSQDVHLGHPGHQVNVGGYLTWC